MCKYVLKKLRILTFVTFTKKKLKILANSVDMKNIDR